jgi:C_GCAxxG_C_C family probable redox protein
MLLKNKNAYYLYENLKTNIMTKSEKAVQYHRDHFNCAQSVLAPFGPDFGISEDDSLKISCAFGGGMGRQQHVCGAVTGALMVLGLKYGKALNDDESKKQFTYAKTNEFFAEFKKLHKSINCKELLNGLNLRDAEDYKKIQELNLFETHCTKYVADAAMIVEKFI